MNKYVDRLLYFLLGATITSLASYYYIDYRIKQAEKRYDAQIQYGFNNATTEIHEGVNRISSELEQRINDEINKVRKQFGISEEPLK